MTRLSAFLVANGLKPARLARDAAVSRQHLLRLRKGTADPSRHVMARLTMASSLLLKRTVRTNELFDLLESGL